MPRATIDYMNARRALMPASGGANNATYRNDADDRAAAKQQDAFDQAIQQAKTVFMDFRLWAETTRQVLYHNGQPELISDPEMEVPF